MKKQSYMAVLVTTATLNSMAQINYPVAPQDGTTYEAFGITVDDRFRPLENDTATATLEWVEAENAVTRGYLDKIQFREAINRRLTALNDFAKTGMPSKENDGLYYWYHNNGLQNQSVLMRGTTPYAADAEVFLDPNTLSQDGTVALTGVMQSKDGKYTAYTISRSGSDWTEIYVLDTASAKLLPDHIEWAKFTGAQWSGDGFYYSAYPRPEAGKEFSNANEFHSVYYHKIGTPQSEDVLVYHNADEPLRFHQADVTEDGRWLLIEGGGQGFGNSLTVKDLSDPAAEWITIEPSQDLTMGVVDTTDDGCLLVYTSDSAPRYRLVKINPKNPVREAWMEVIPESAEGVLKAVYPAGDRLIALYDRDASHHAYVYDREGRLQGEIKFPTYGSAGFSTSRKSPEVYYSFSSFTYPSEIYSLDLETLESTPVHATAVAGLNPSDYVTEQVFYPSADGTRVPMFITYKKGLKKDGTNPVYLYGYGGFNISLNPGFSPSRMLWLENGGIYAQANLRGGAEYGDAWHTAGTKMQKQNVFDDFIAAGEYMVKEGWTTPELLTIEGGSNGGLLVGAVVNQRPELFRVAIPRVGVMDMMRYHLFTIGWNWASDYGTADDSAEMAAYLLGYSPLHTIKNDGTPYPAIMVTTADHDDRVVPAHSFKYAAALQAANTGDEPKLIRIDSKAGHGAGKPIAKVIDEWTDIYSFIYNNLGISPATDR
ncbi:MAG: prolyl oligopeptidase family serine peptidase [Muribaculaceae bacterium]|nr:prolyl oligopeptidase family serine peptidase [Muribaculaceae bacterium]